MKDRTLIINTLSKVGVEVMLSGWVQTVRSHGKIAFLDLRDRSGVMQVGGFGPDLASKFANLGQQDVIEVTGKVKKREDRYINKDLPTGTVEVEALDVAVVSKASEMPFDMGGKELTLQLPTLLDYRPLTLRHQAIRGIFTVQAAILEGFRKAAEELHCIEIVVPTIAASTTEGGAEVFMVDYFDHKVFLTQSPQLYKQMMVPIFERVWTIAHAYRAEPSVTTRHLTETTQMDCEFGFVEFEELLTLLEKVAGDMVMHAQKKAAHVFAEFHTPALKLGKIPRLSLREAQEVIFKETGRDNRKEKDLTPQDEIDICLWAAKNHNSDFVTITRFPTLAKPFYTMPDPKNPEYSLSYDLLFRGVEVLSGSQRIHEYTALVKSLVSRGMNPDAFSLYLQAFKYGMPPEGGFSFGLERMTMKMLNLENIRQASLYPRDMERVDERFTRTTDKE